MLEPVEDIPAAGTLLLGKYRVERVLGQGGMGIVVAAMHEVLHQRVALKFLTAKALTDTAAVERFLREARAAVQLQSEHVAKVSDVGKLENGAPYMVMEFLEGCDLSALLAQQRVLPVPFVADSVIQAIDAVAEAHARGIVHRDLKPSNLFLAGRAEGGEAIKVLDFGISKSSEPFGPGGVEQASLTSTAAVMGSPLYMSPEQFRSAKKVDSRTDIWALGTILYELLGGKPPFDGDSVGEVFASVLQNEPVSLLELRRDVPPALEQVVMRCLRKNADERFATVAELAQALLPFGTAESHRWVDRSKKLLAGRISTKTSPDTTISSPEDDSAATLAVAARPVQQTSNAWANAASSPRKRSVMPKLVGIGVVAIVVCGAALGALYRYKPTTAARLPESATPIVSEPVPAPVPPATASTAQQGNSSAPSAIAAAVSVPVPVHSAPPPAHTKPRTPPSAKATTSAPAASTAPVKPPSTSILDDRH
jgi:serine/threonine protein kinase